MRSSVSQPVRTLLTPSRTHISTHASCNVSRPIIAVLNVAASALSMSPSPSAEHRCRSLHTLPFLSSHRCRPLNTSRSSVPSLSSSLLSISMFASRPSFTTAGSTLSSSSSASSSHPAVSAPYRSFVSSRPLLGFEEFFANQQPGRTGRMWRCSDLRLKSFDDLQKLWIVLLKERNMLLTYRHQCTTTQTKMANPERLQKVKKSMAHIKMVLGERHREVRERTEEPDSEWRKTREEKRRKRALIKKQEHKRLALPKQMHRQKERHPKRKKIKFRGVRPRASTETSEQQAQQAAQAGQTGQGIEQAQSAA